MRAATEEVTAVREVVAVVAVNIGSVLFDAAFWSCNTTARCAKFAVES